ENQLLDTVRSRNRLSEDHKALQQLEADLASKTSSLAEAEGVVGTLKGDLERLTVDLSQSEIVRNSFICQLLPNVVQSLLSSDEYKKNMSDVFNLAIAVGWSEGMKAGCSEEEAQAFLAISVDCDPTCKETFMFEFDSLFDKSYPYVRKLAESFWLPLGDLQNMWPEGDGRHLAIGSWAHPERLAFRVTGVTWPLALGHIRNVLRFGRRLAIGSWTHSKRLAFRVMGVTWPLALGLIRNVMRSG
nr:hypothetical protein [Tanacetum cinerariifolium]